MKSIPVTTLMEDGIGLYVNDKVANNITLLPVHIDNLEWAGDQGLLNFKDKENKADLIRNFNRYSVTSFEERSHNISSKQPVPNKTVVEVVTTRGETLVDTAESFNWSLTCINPILTWKPHFDSLYKRYNKAPESDSKEQKEESDAMNKLSGEKSSEEVSDAPVYTKEMYDQGILPEVGSIVYYEMPYSNEVRGGVVTMLAFFRGIVHVMLGTVSISLKDLIFPEPEKTFEEKVVDKMESFFENNFGCFDKNIVMNTYKAFKDTEKELQDD